jgi:hypothetical protein
MPLIPPIRLSDSELAAVFEAARPLDVSRRDAFLQDVATLLHGCVEIGPGTVHRICAEVQRRHWDPPDFSRAAGGTGKYR